MYFPIFFELLGENKLDWKTITKVFNKKLDQWHQKHDLTGQMIRVEASLFNIITAFIQGNPQATNYLDFIRKIFEELIQKLDNNERKLIVPALYGLLTNINRMYLNFLGELCVLNSIKSKTNFILVDVEVPVDLRKPNGSKIDFKLLNPKNSTFLLVEIVNVHLNDVAEWSDEKVNRLLHEKIQGKLNITGIRSNNNFHLIPVFWGSFGDLTRIDQYYTKNQISFKNTSEPVCYTSFTIQNGQHVHMFGTIRSIMEIYAKSNQTQGGQ